MTSETAYLVAVSIVSFLLGAFGKYLKTYASQKGRNLATKEDIADITARIEAVRAEFVRQRDERREQHEILLKQQDLQQQLRLAALDRRLEVHQEAYALWWELMAAVYEQQKVGPAVMACQDWWVRNCLYLSGEVRPAFSVAYHSALTYNEAYRSSKDVIAGRGVRDVMKENFEAVRRVGELLVRATPLPDLAADDIDPKPVLPTPPAPS
jgi:hypothetical protein